ncbi:MAG: amidohydrolase [Syntrophomonadaceae bacterium]|jgi:predicted amidohydrolase YtcJ|nr:amidohydrolase [Syntrophomonadaceae bacterium]
MSNYTYEEIDMVFMNGKVITMDPENSTAEAIAIKNDLIVMVGTNESVKPFISKSTQVIDLGGKTLLPGFIDPHNHFGQMAIAKLGLDLSPSAGVKSIADLQNKLLFRAANQTNDWWINGTSYDENKLEEKRHPNRWDIDQVVSDRPVILMHFSGHIAVLNSKAMEVVSITNDTPVPTAGKFGRDENGDLDGIFYGEAFWKLTEYYPRLVPPPSTLDICKGMKALGRDYLEEGITTVGDAVSYPWTFKAYQTLWKQKQLPLRVVMYIRNSFFDDFVKTGLVSGFGDKNLKIGGIKFFIDGSMSAGTAAVSDSPGYNQQLFCYTKEEITEMVNNIQKAGFQVAAHANGDIAINMFLDAVEEALQKNPIKDHRTRIEHCSVVNQEIIERIKKIGALPTIFAPMAWYHGDKVKRCIDPEKEKWAFAFRSFLDAGIPVSGHTDYPANPYAPRYGLYSQVSRTTRDSKQLFGPEQRISVLEALRTWTVNAAYATFDENIKGSIEPGKLADLVVLDWNPLLVEPQELKDLKVMMTVVGGEIRFVR